MSPEARLRGAAARPGRAGHAPRRPRQPYAGTVSEHAAPDLPARETVLLAAFEGWNDAGSAATAALEHLHDVWGAE